MFNDVEMAILSQVSYRSYDGMPPGDLNDFLTKNRSYLEESLGEKYMPALNSLIDKTASQSYKIVAAEEDSPTGFAAFAVEGPGHEVTAVCRGTEINKLSNDNKSDNHEAYRDLVEDYQLTKRTETNQQVDMRRFVDGLEKNGYNGYYFTGHSLGGNLALHGAISLDDPTKVKGVTTYNAPGYNQDYLEKNELRYKKIADKTTLYQAESDSVSSAMLPAGNVVVVDCKKQDWIGIDSHFMKSLVLDESGTGFKSSDTQNKKTTVLGSALDKGSNIIYRENKKSQQKETKKSTWGGTTIKVPLSELAQHANTMQGFADTNADVFDRVYNSLLCLKENGEWQGTSVDAIITATENNREKFSETINELQALADFLQKFVTEISEKDEEIRRQINTV